MSLPAWFPPAPVWIALLGGRLVVLLAALVAESGGILPPEEAVTSDGTRLRVDGSPLLASLTSWDAVYYVDIAERGYVAGPVNGPFPNTVFFPLLPLLMRALTAVTGLPPALAGVLLANLFLVAAVIVIYAVGRRLLGESQARWGAVVVAIAPGSTAFSMLYTDSLFLLVTAAALGAAELGRARTAGWLYALSTLTRPPGILLGIPVAIALVRSSRRLPGLIWLLAGPAALGALMLVQHVVTGDALAFITGQAAWEGPASVLPAAQSGSYVFTDPLGRFVPDSVLIASVRLRLAVTLAIYVVATAVAVRWRLPASAVAHMAITVALVILVGRLHSADRYLAVLFPLGWVLAAMPIPMKLLWTAFAVTALFLGSFMVFRLALPP
jgi:hypothetical protein